METPNAIETSTKISARPPCPESGAAISTRAVVPYTRPNGRSVGHVRRGHTVVHAIRSQLQPIRTHQQVGDELGGITRATVEMVEFRVLRQVALRMHCAIPEGRKNRLIREIEAEARRVGALIQALGADPDVAAEVAELRECLAELLRQRKALD